MKEATKILGLSLKVGPLGENDRLLTILSAEEGIVRLSVPGARRPKSSLSATAPMNLLELYIGGKSNLKKVRQIKIIKSFSKLGSRLETLAAAQVLSELALLLVGTNDPQPTILEVILLHLERLEKDQRNSLFTLANCIQSCVHLLALGGYSLPLNECCTSKIILTPPIGDWDWRCSFFPDEGFAIGSFSNAKIELNPSELALLQRLIRPQLPVNKKGELLGPIEVWEKLLVILESWIEIHLPKKLNSLQLLKSTIIQTKSL